MQSGIGKVEDNSTATAVPPLIPDSGTIYYNTWLAALSTFGLFNTLIGLLVMGIVGISPFVIISLLNSTAIAVAWGLGWIAYNSLYSTKMKVTSSVIADMFWLLQHCSLSFYSFFIVRKIVKGRERRVYYGVFFFLEGCICIMRVPIIVSRVIAAHADTLELEARIGYYHTGYYVAIALCESWNAYFLLRKFYKAERRRKAIFSSTNSGISNSTSVSSNAKETVQSRFRFRLGFYSALIRSSEIRLASLCSLGVMRSITFTQNKNPGPAFDNFAACFESMFSTVFLVDILATRLAYYEQRYSGSRYDQGLEMESERDVQDRERQDSVAVLEAGLGYSSAVLRREHNEKMEGEEEKQVPVVQRIQTTATLETI